MFATCILVTRKFDSVCILRINCVVDHLTTSQWCRLRCCCSCATHSDTALFQFATNSNLPWVGQSTNWWKIPQNIKGEPVLILFIEFSLSPSLQNILTISLLNTFTFASWSQWTNSWTFSTEKREKEVGHQDIMMTHSCILKMFYVEILWFKEHPWVYSLVIHSRSWCILRSDAVASISHL